MDAKPKTGELLFRYRRIIITVALFVCACACVTAGLLMLSPSGEKAHVRQVAQEASTGPAKADVLLLLSYDDSHVNTSPERMGVLDVMHENGIGVDVEYMDSVNAPASTPSYDAWVRSLTDKLIKHGSYKTVICADDEALGFVDANRDTLFANTPVVFFGVNDFAHARNLVSTGRFTGVLEESYLANTMQLAKKLVPGANRFLAVFDDTPTGMGDRARFQEALALVPGMSAEYVNASSMTRSTLGDTVSAAGEDAIVFYLDAANDAQDNAYGVGESAAYLAQAASSPVFRGTIGGVGDGVCGSGFVDLEGDGQRAAKMAISILGGASPSSIPLQTDGAGGYVFDASAMASHGLSVDALPANATVINAPVISMRSISEMIIPILLILAGMLLVVVFFIIEFRRSSDSSREDETQKSNLEQRLFIDPLTDKPNMQWLFSFAQTPEAAKVRSVIEVNAINLDDVNEAYGPEAGDKVTLQLADRLDSLGASFLVSTGGSAFVLGFPQVIIASSTLLKMIESTLSKPYVYEDNPIELVTCIGVANHGIDTSFDDLVFYAEHAVRLAEEKERESGHEVVFFDRDMRQAMRSKLEITACLKDAIRNDGFVVYYQPVVDVENNDVIGYEALVRLKNGQFPPAQFIPVAETTGLVVNIGRIVTEKAVRQLATWKKRNKRIRPISINYSFAQLKDEGYVDFLLGILDKYGVSPSLIKIEITEALFAGNSAIGDDLLKRLMDAGVSIALDDFGIGYTSISRILSIPAETIKIDKSLVDTYMNTGKEELIGNLAELVHGLGKKVNVEGIETREQAEICRRLGCDMVQGFYFSKPLLPERAAQYKPAKTEAA